MTKNPPPTLTALFDAHQKTRAALVAGIEADAAQLAAQAHADPVAALPADLRAICEAVCAHYHVTLAQMLSRSKLAHVARARLVSSALASLLTGLPDHALAPYFRRSVSAFARARKVVTAWRHAESGFEHDYAILLAESKAAARAAIAVPTPQTGAI